MQCALLYKQASKQASNRGSESMKVEGQVGMEGKVYRGDIVLLSDGPVQMVWKE